MVASRGWNDRNMRQVFAALAFLPRNRAEVRGSERKAGGLAADDLAKECIARYPPSAMPVVKS